MNHAFVPHLENPDSEPIIQEDAEHEGYQESDPIRGISIPHKEGALQPFLILLDVS